VKSKLLFVVICCQAFFAQSETKSAGNMPYASTALDHSKRVVSEQACRMLRAQKKPSSGKTFRSESARTWVSGKARK